MTGHTMPWRTVTLMTLMVVSPLLAQRGGLTDEQVDAAIAAAKQPGWTSLFVEAKGRFGAYYSVLLQGSVGRTMDLARDTFESYKPLTAATVPATVKAPAVTLAVVRHRDSNGVIAIKNVVLMPPGAGRDAAIQPLPPGRLFQDRRPRTWRPGLGSEPSDLAGFYRFAEHDLPSGDLEIVVVTNAREEHYTVKAQDRDRLR